MLRIEIEKKPEFINVCTTIDITIDGKKIITGWSDGKIRMFLPQSGKLIAVINENPKESHINCLKLGEE